MSKFGIVWICIGMFCGVASFDASAATSLNSGGDIASDAGWSNNKPNSGSVGTVAVDGILTASTFNYGAGTVVNQSAGNIVATDGWNMFSGSWNMSGGSVTARYFNANGSTAVFNISGGSFVIGSAYTGTRVFQINAGGKWNISGTAVLDGTYATTTPTVGSGAGYDIATDWTGSWIQGNFSGTTWKTTLTGNAKYTYDGSPITSTIFDENFLISPDGKTLTLNIPTAPTASDDDEAAFVGSATNLYVMANDSNADGIISVDASATNSAGDTVGSVSVGPGNAYVIFTGTEVDVGYFSYVVTNTLGSATGMVAVTTTLPPPPTAVADTVTVVFGSATNLYVLANDSNADGISSVDATATNSAGDTVGSVSVGPGNAYVIFTGTEVDVGYFSYVVTNADGSATGMVTVTITPVRMIENSLLAYYPFDSNFLDASTNNNDLTIAAKTPTITTTAGEFAFGGGALDVDEFGEYLNLASPITFDAATPWSVSFWGKRRPGAALTTGMICGDPPSKNSFIWIPAHTTVSSLMGLVFRNRSNVASDWYIVDDNAFHHWVVVADGEGNISAYRDNVALTPEAATTTFKISSVAHAYNTTAANTMDGQIDELRIYSDALNATEVSNLYSFNATSDPAPDGTLFLFK